ncbi:hypothetical protein C1752_03610 [Acaryochloris thomasi RCC1774]|uniref:Uncharacterized protein n=1 Tax=Acaryochloris thomasi RCC1774 TaxID=1764569 RepID=A0A2W1JG22_9CYAN|nr:hypothetical protein C1752_03610 [Acaryochloris thomasi RCC1774]
MPSAETYSALDREIVQNTDKILKTGAPALLSQRLRTIAQTLDKLLSEGLDLC